MHKVACKLYNRVTTLVENSDTHLTDFFSKYVLFLYQWLQSVSYVSVSRPSFGVSALTLLGLGLIKINDVSANFTNPRPSLILNN